jgi:RNA chaperone Hfq
MEVPKEEPRQQTIEPQFLSQAQANGTKLRIGQMNKTEHEGVIRDIGRYEINLEENGRIVTLLKQEISFFTAEHPVLTVPAPGQENQFLTLFLVNGQRIKAVIEAYDSFTILLREGGRQHLYYKHSITTINR